MNKKILDRLRKSFRELEEGEHLPPAPRRVVASSDPGLPIAALGNDKKTRRGSHAAADKDDSRSETTR